MQIIRILLVCILFCIFGIICIIGNLIFIPICILKLNKSNVFKNLSRDMVYFSWKFFIFCTKNLGYLDYEFNNIKPKSSSIIIANHPSLLDVVLILSNIRRINCIVKKELQKNLFLSPAILACGYIPNTSNEELLEKSKKVLENNETLLIFPEGTRTKDKIVFHKAAFYLAINAAKNIVPLFIDMQPKSLQKGDKWYKTTKRKIRYKITSAKEIKIDDFYPNSTNPIRVRRLYNTFINIYKEKKL